MQHGGYGMKKVNIGSVKIIPLGGLEQIGMNITAIQYDDSIIVVDCGLSFPEEEMLGIDLVIPDVTFLKQNLDKVKGFVITHGHEDHIGAIPYVLKDVNVPIYATKLTMGLIESKLKEHSMLRSVKRKVVKYGQSITLGDFRVEFIRTNHSIADAAALAIFDANVAIIRRLFLLSLKILSNVAPTVRSDIVNPGRRALVLSHISASTPFFPSSPSLCKSIGSP